MPFTTANSWLNKQLAETIAHFFTGTGLSLKVKLAQAPFNPVVTSAPGDFTEATFTGYVAQAITAFVTPHNDANNQSIAEGSTLALFTGTGVLTTPQDIGGYWVEDSAGEYVGGEAFSAPFHMTGAATPLSFAVAVMANRGVFTATILP